MKLVKSWEVLGLFNQRVLEEIAAQHNLRSLVSVRLKKLSSIYL